MGLFINNLEHPRVFKNEGSIQEPNQAYFKIDYVSELVRRQEEVNEKLLHAFYGLQVNHRQQAYAARNRWEATDRQVKKLEDSHLRQERLSEDRSEEHTSELQSRGHLVCRLLLETKNLIEARTGADTTYDRCH